VLLLVLLVLILCGAGVTRPARAQQAEGSPPAVETQPPPSSRDVATYTLPPEKYEKARALARAEYALYAIRFLYGLLILLALLAWRVAPRFRDWAERASSRRIVQALIFVPLLLLTIRVLRLPTAVAGHWLLVQYGLSVQGWPSWAWDWSKGALISLAIYTFVGCVLYAIIRRSPRRWWLWFWLAVQPIVVVGVFLTPLIVDPLFYQYTPLERTQPALVPEIEKVVRRGGLEIPRERMFEMKASEKWNAANAYVTGIGASKRVVVWDTTLRLLTIPQTLAVFGHEMGHYVLNHIPKGIALSAAGLFLAFFLAFRVLDWTLARWGARWEIRGPGDWASLPALLLIASLFSFLGQPVENAVSRYIEHEADVYGLEVTRGIVPNAGRVAAEAQQMVAEAALEDPDPPRLVVYWLYSHPPSRDRIEFARSYDPWSRGQPPKFVK